MRRVPLNQVNDEMRLAQPIYQNNQLLLDRGTNCLTKYTEKLNNLGIFSVYIEDDLSADIQVPDAVCEQTRQQCMSAVQSVFDNLEKQGNFDASVVDGAIKTLIHDLFSRKDILVSLSQISTIDDGTMVHSVNTTILCLLIGKRNGLDRQELAELAEGAILHDVGKIGLNEDILLKASTLTKEEFSHIKEHPSIGYSLLQRNDSLPELSKIIALQHHERLDGSGYPNGLTGEQIHPFAQITAIADMYDALTTERCYRKSLSNLKAYHILMQDAASGKLNAKLLPLLFDHVAIYPNGIIVNLSNKTHGIVKIQNPGMPFSPIIRVIDDRNSKVTLYDVDLSIRTDIKIIES